VQLDLLLVPPPHVPSKTRRPALATGKQLGVMGAQRAADHAEFETPHWKDYAYAFFLTFARSRGEFTTEQVRHAATHLPPPPDNRAWGQVARRAKDAKKVRHVRYEAMKDPKCHGAPRSVWKWIGTDE
jgi:hypothetical protein